MIQGHVGLRRNNHTNIFHSNEVTADTIICISCINFFKKW